VLRGISRGVLRGISRGVLRGISSGVLRGISRPRREEVTAKWGKLHIEELHDLYFSRCVVRVITSRWMKWAGHVARMGTKKCIQCFGGET
jgi:hypothetical protein